MYGFNGQYPGPLIRAPQRATVIVRFTNRLDQPSTVHWHGVRLENRSDGVPEMTQAEVQPGAGYVYRVTLRDAGIYGATVALLLLTLAIAEETRGARAWLFSGRLQPSEFSKIGMVIGLAHYFGRNPPSQIRRLRDLFLPGLIVAVPVGLIVLQKDLGVAVLTLLVIISRHRMRAFTDVSSIRKNSFLLFSLSLNYKASNKIFGFGFAVCHAI